MKSMTMWTLWTILVTKTLNLQLFHLIIPSSGLQMALGWRLYIRRISRFFSHHHLDGNGVYHMVSNLLQSRRHSYAMLRPMNPYTESALHLDSNQLCSALRSDLLTLSRQRPVHGMQCTVLIPLSTNMLAFTAWHAMHTGGSAMDMRLVRTSHNFRRMTFI